MSNNIKIKEIPTSTNEVVASAEEIKGILLAEELAYAQVDAERSVYVDANEQGMKSAKKTLTEIFTKYPDIQAYRPLFREGLDSLLKTKTQVDLYWNEFVGKEKELTASSLLKGLELPQADPEVSKDLAENLFELPLAGEVHALKSDYFIFFVVNNSDFKKLESELFGATDTQGEDPDPTGGRFTVLKGLPVVIADEQDEEDLFFLWLHESQHAFDHLFKKAKEKQMLKALYGSEDSVSRQIGRRLIKDSIGPTAQEVTAKNEIFSYFTMVWWKDLQAYLMKYEGEKVATSDDIREVLNDIVDIMAPGENYHREHDPILRKANVAVEAVVSLREMYMQVNDAWLADRIVVTLLSQFPLKSWAAVAEMLEKAHQSSPVKKLDFLVEP